MEIPSMISSSSSSCSLLQFQNQRITGPRIGVGFLNSTIRPRAFHLHRSVQRFEFFHYQDILAAGTETSSNTMCWVLSELIRHPDIMYKAQIEIREALGGKIEIEDSDITDLHYLHNVIKETLRLHPPLPFLLPRMCKEITELLGFLLPARTQVVVNAWAISRDPKIWKNPDSFIPDRFNGSSHDLNGTSHEYMPFGSGRRICPGLAFAMASLKLFLALLLFHFDWKIPDGKDPMELNMEEEFDGTARRKNDLYLIAIPYCL